MYVCMTVCLHFLSVFVPFSVPFLLPRITLTKSTARFLVCPHNPCLNQALRMEPQFHLLLEHFETPQQLLDAVTCCEDCVVLMKQLATSRPRYSNAELNASDSHSEVHELVDPVVVTSGETKRLRESVNSITILLEETKHAVSVVKETRQSVKSRKEHNVERTKEAFNTLRNVIDEREEQIRTDIVTAADKRERALKVGMIVAVLRFLLGGRRAICICTRDCLLGMCHR